MSANPVVEGRIAGAMSVANMRGPHETFTLPSAQLAYETAFWAEVTRVALERARTANALLNGSREGGGND